jgi:hypothetical protein
VRASAAKDGALSRLTILLDVAPAEQLRTILRTSDEALLIDGLLSLIEELPARSVRLVMFDLTQQKEVFRREGFTTDALPEVVQALNSVHP